MVSQWCHNRVSKQAATRGRVPKTASIAFRTDALHAGQDSYSPVSPVYFDRPQFKFSGPLTTGHQRPRVSCARSGTT